MYMLTRLYIIYCYTFLSKERSANFYEITTGNIRVDTVMHSKFDDAYESLHRLIAHMFIMKVGTGFHKFVFS